VRDQDGGSAYVLYRKDRIVCSKGASHLQRFKLSEGSVTNRAVATCCNSAMFVDFDKGPFWVSVYRSRLQGDPPPLQMRICMNVRPADRDGIPSYRGRPLSFVAKLLGSGTAMLLRR